MKIRCVVSCVNSSGSPVLLGTVVTCTRAAMNDGKHYDKAKEVACQQDYEGPMLVYDEGDGPGWLFENIFNGRAEVIPPASGRRTGCTAKKASPGTVTHDDVSVVKMVAGNEKRIRRVIWNDNLMDWVAIGWIVVRSATDADRAKYPTVAG